MARGLNFSSASLTGPSFQKYHRSPTVITCALIARPFARRLRILPQRGPTCPPGSRARQSAGAAALST
eukprot:6064949-Pyramimonas_sp.AAC.1